MKIVLQEIRDDAVRFLRVFAGIFNTYRRTFLLLGVLVVLSAFLLLPYDHSFSRYIYETRKESIVNVARDIRHWGAFIDTITVTLLIFLIGFIARRRRWRQLAVAFFLAALLSGLFANIFRLTTGRPRPKMQFRQIPDRFYGPILIYPKRWIPGHKRSFYSFQSFPSGHCAASFGGAVMLLVAAPPIGVPMMISASSIAWASLYKQDHYPTDVAVGSGIGVIFGLVGGLAYRRMRDQTV